MRPLFSVILYVSMLVLFIYLEKMSAVDEQIESKHFMLRLIPLNYVPFYLML